MYESYGRGITGRQHGSFCDTYRGRRWRR
jgi:hypothetical protein